MATFKGTMIFSMNTIPAAGNAATRVGGWSESVYGSYDSVGIFTTPFLQLCASRAALLPASASIIGQRYQAILPLGGSSTTNNVFPGRSDMDTDLPQVSLLYRLRGLGVGNARPYYIRCIPDDLVKKGEFVPTPAYTAQLGSFFGRLASVFQFRARSLAADRYPFLTISNTGAYITTLPTIWAVDTIVSISRALKTDGKFINGRFRVATVTTPQTGTFSNWPAEATTGGVGFSRSIIYPTFAPIESGQINSGRAVVRKVGRPFGQFRGRQSSRS